MTRWIEGTEQILRHLQMLPSGDELRRNAESLMARAEEAAAYEPNEGRWTPTLGVSQFPRARSLIPASRRPSQLPARRLSASSPPPAWSDGESASARWDQRQSRLEQRVTQLELSPAPLAQQVAFLRDEVHHLTRRVRHLEQLGGTGAVAGSAEPAVSAEPAASAAEPRAAAPRPVEESRAGGGALGGDAAASSPSSAASDSAQSAPSDPSPTADPADVPEGAAEDPAARAPAATAAESPAQAEDAVAARGPAEAAPPPAAADAAPPPAIADAPPPPAEAAPAPEETAPVAAPRPAQPLRFPEVGDFSTALRTLIGGDVELKWAKPTAASLESGPLYWCDLVSDDDVLLGAMVVSQRAAFALGAAMLMLPASQVDEMEADPTLAEEALDAMSEIFNALSGRLNAIEGTPHVRTRTLRPYAEEQDGWLVRATNRKDYEVSSGGRLICAELPAATTG